MKKLKVEGTLELKLDKKDVDKNIKSLEKIKSKLEVESNINAIIKQCFHLPMGLILTLLHCHLVY
jgi:hypothetical protein